MQITPKKSEEDGLDLEGLKRVVEAAESQKLGEAIAPKKQEKKPTKPVLLDLDVDLHSSIKTAAAQNKLYMKEWMIEALREKLAREQ